MRFNGQNNLISSNLQASQVFGFAEGLSQMPLGALTPNDSDTQQDLEDLISQARAAQAPRASFWMPLRLRLMLETSYCTFAT